VTGHLAGRPSERFAKSGSSYAVAKLRVGSGTEFVLVNVAAFTPGTVVALLRLQDGDAVAISGALTPRTMKDQNGVIALDLVAGALLTKSHQGLRTRLAADA
jgi:hypothetical protein